VIEVDGIVRESLPNSMFRVELVATKNVIVCSTSGRMRKNFVRVLVGDPVKVSNSLRISWVVSCDGIYIHGS